MISPGHSLAADGCCCPVRVISQLSQPNPAQPSQPSTAQPSPAVLIVVVSSATSPPLLSPLPGQSSHHHAHLTPAPPLRTHHKEQRLYIVTENCTFGTFLTATRYLLFASKLREVCSISFVFGVSLNHKGSIMRSNVAYKWNFLMGKDSVCLCHGKTSVAIALTYSYTPKLLLALMIF